jgi:acetyl-CoA acetyltransferase/uncharacterized OB-fold protein
MTPQDNTDPASVGPSAELILNAARCTACRQVTFPSPLRCPWCFGRDMESISLSNHGTLFEWTTVHRGAPGFTAPYPVGYLDVPEGVRLFGQLELVDGSPPAPGDRFTIVTPTSVSDGEPRLPYIFSPSVAGSESGAETTSRFVDSPGPRSPAASPRRRGVSRSVAIAGVGMTRFGRYGDVTAEQLAQSAILDALDDAGVSPAEIGCVFVGHVFQGRVAGQRIVREVGLMGLPLINVENACASGASALNLAIESVASGRVEAALAVGVEQLSRLGGGVIPPDKLDIEGAHGRTNPATYAIMAKRHKATHGTTDAQLASVVVQARVNGHHNERAQLRELTSIDEVLASPMIASPLSRLQCCPIGDGAAAAVVVSAGVAKRLESLSVRVLASVVRGGVRRAAGDPFVSHPVTRLAAHEAFENSGIGPGDVDVAEVHDAFSIAELVHLEDLGFYEAGQAGFEVARGSTAIGGTLPVNPSGGLLAKGHPLGATGLAQVFELVDQLRGRGRKRQVDGARIGLAQCEGGVVYGLDAGVCVIHILAA